MSTTPSATPSRAPIPPILGPMPDWAVLAGVEHHRLAELVEARAVTREDLLDSLDADMTGVLRGAYHNRYLADAVREHLGFRPLPLLTTIERAKGGSDGAQRRSIPVKLYPHQVQGIAFMCERERLDPAEVYGLRGGIIRMEMGMGKTLQAICHALISRAPRVARAEAKAASPRSSSPRARS